MTTQTCRTCRFRVRPEKQATARKMAGLAGACRNTTLDRLKADHEKTGHCNFRRMSKSNKHGQVGTSLAHTQWKQSDACPEWLAEHSDNIVRESALTGLERAHKLFFSTMDKGGSPPKFKNRHTTDPSFTIPANCFKLEGKRLAIRKLGTVRLVGKRKTRDGMKPMESMSAHWRPCGHAQACAPRARG